MSDKESSEEPEEVVIDRSKLPAPKPKPRIVVKETIYHQRDFRENPITLSKGFCAELSSDEEPYQRKPKIGEKWEPLDCGWLSLNRGTIRIENLAKQEKQGILSEEEEAELAKQVIRIRFSADSCGDIAIPPGEAVRFRPHTNDPIGICCSHGTVRYSLFIVPR